jgi:hypothetical protein
MNGVDVIESHACGRYRQRCFYLSDQDDLANDEIRAILTADIQGKQCSFMRSLLDKDLWLMQFGYKPSNTGGVVDE